MKLGTIWEAWRKAGEDTREYHTAWIVREINDGDPELIKWQRRMYERRDRQRLKFVDRIIDHIEWWDTHTFAERPEDR